MTVRRALLPLALAALSGCGEHATAPATPIAAQTAVIDLLAQATRAEREPAEGAEGSQRLAIDSDDSRDGFAPLRCPSGCAFTFRGLATRGAARVAFSVGSLRAAPGDGPLVSFSVQAWREPFAEGAKADASWQQSLRGADLPAAGQPFELALPGDGDARWTLRLSVQGGGEPAPDWPAFLSPRVLHAGGAAPGPLEIEDVVADLDARLLDATVVQQSAALPVQRAYFDAAANVGTAGGRRAVIRAAAPARVRWTLVPPAGAALRFAAGVDTWSGWKKGGDGLNFAVEIDGERIWQLALDPHHRAQDRGWKPVRLDLARWAGRKIALDLITEPGATPDFDIGGFSEAALVQPRETPRRRADEAPNIVLVVIDTLRADRLGFDGHDGGLSPRLDALAARGLVFRAAHSVASWTWPATATLLTGLYPNSHGVLDSKRCLLVDALSTLAEQYEAAGYTTGGFSANHLVDADNRFDQGFETFVCEPNATARALSQRALDWIDATPGVARMLYLHLFDPHAPYAAPAPFTADWPADLPRTLEELGPRADDPEMQRRVVDALAAGYDAEVRYVDAALGEFFDALAARGELRDTLVVLTADHGEEFHEHGLLSHGPHLYEETVAVPLIAFGYGHHAVPPGMRDEPVSLVDVVPTLLAAAGLPDPPYPLPGRSLLGPPAAETLYAQTLQGLEDGVEGFTEKLSIADEGWKLVRTPASKRLELYDLRADPGETRDLSAQEPARLDALAARLEQWRTMTASRTPDNLVAPDAELLRRLKAMGYLGK